ncbi:MAG: type II toxin-antitoxin system RelB/DinJ family antitoxin [Clostridiales bacterium]|nr:type II toxin-antitoxin system RelB/DinJ family antitoxin [Clostridiales bacterium]
MRINPEIKKQVEDIYAACGMTLTDAINAFLQQSINVGGLPFLVTTNGREALREQALFLLMQERQAGGPPDAPIGRAGAEPLEEFGT